MRFSRDIQAGSAWRERMDGEANEGRIQRQAHEAIFRLLAKRQFQAFKGKGYSSMTDT